MKKVLPLLAFAAVFSLFANQKMTIHNSDGTTYTHTTDNIDSITFTPVAESLVTGLGTIEFAILGEDIPYDNLNGDGMYLNLKNATITEAYILVKAPTLMPSHRIRHVGESLSGMFAVDLMPKDANRTAVHLGYLSKVEAGSYENPPKIVIDQPAPYWADVKGDANALSELQSNTASFLFRGTMVDISGKSYNYEIRENITAVIDIEEFPTASNGVEGTPLHLAPNDTLLAEFHPHIDHALEVFAIENRFDMSQFSTTLIKGKEVIVFSDTENRTGINSRGEEIRIYDDIVSHINRGDHWDVNVIP